ncbi:restriction endonuclease [Azospirillum argentinense]
MAHCCGIGGFIASIQNRFPASVQDNYDGDKTVTFTASARETADRLGTRIVLIDGIQLAKLMIRHEVGCRIEETLHIKRVDEDFFE